MPEKAGPSMGLNVSCNEGSFGYWSGNVFEVQEPPYEVLWREMIAILVEQCKASQSRVRLFED